MTDGREFIGGLSNRRITCLAGGGDSENFTENLIVNFTVSKKEN